MTVQQTKRPRGRPRHPDVLTPAEWRVLEKLRLGLSNPQIAVELGVSPDAVKYHISNMLGKLGLDDRFQLANWQPGQQRSLGRWWMLAPLVRLPAKLGDAGGRAAATLETHAGAVVFAGLALAAAVWAVVFLVSVNTGENDQPTEGTVAAAAENTVIAPAPTDSARPEQTTEPQVACPLDGSVCVATEQVESLVLNEDSAGLAALARLQPCLLEGSGAGVNCGPELAGNPDAVQAHLYTRLLSEAAAMTLDDYQAFLDGWSLGIQPQASDNFGGGPLQLVTIGCPSSEVATGCTGQFVAVFTAMRAEGGSAPFRDHLLFHVEPADGELEIAVTQSGVILEQHAPLITGGEIELTRPDGDGPVSYMFFPLTAGG
jgi:DNA-binding CsgD family transcriptional regulator